MRLVEFRQSCLDMLHMPLQQRGERWILLAPRGQASIHAEILSRTATRVGIGDDTPEVSKAPARRMLSRPARIPPAAIARLQESVAQSL
jgi:hypothetical protein